MFPEFTFTDLRTGAQQSIRALCSQNEAHDAPRLGPDGREVDPVRRGGRYGAITKALRGAGLAVVPLITPEGDRYKQAAEQYLATHEVEWPVVADYADAEGADGSFSIPKPIRAICSSTARKGWSTTYTRGHSGMAGTAALRSSPTEEFQYMNYMNRVCSKYSASAPTRARTTRWTRRPSCVAASHARQGVDIVLIGEVFTDVDIRTGLPLCDEQCSLWSVSS